MTRPSQSEADHLLAERRRLAAGFVFLVGLSGATMAQYGGASLLAIALAFVTGVLVGASLLWYVRRMTT